MDYHVTRPERMLKVSYAFSQQLSEKFENIKK